jgi:hypothetical protein
MWTNVNQVYSTNHSQNSWAHLAGTNAWHKILTGAADGVTNVFVVLATARASNRQVYVVLDANKNITAVYM